MKKIKSVMIFMGSVSIGALIFLVWMCALTGCSYQKYKPKWDEIIQQEIETFEKELDQWYKSDAADSFFNSDLDSSAVYLDLFSY